MSGILAYLGSKGMKLHKLTLSGFRSFSEEIVIEFEKGAIYILGENKDNPKKWQSNGAGKTSLITAIRWCLYGRTNTGAEKDRVINRRSEEAFVEISFKDLIVRRRKTRGQSEELSYFFNGRWVEGDLKEVQSRLIKTIGVSPRLFDNSIWIDRKSRSVQFLHATPAERLAILEEILNDSLYYKAQKIIFERKKELIQNRDQAIAKIEELAEELEQQRRMLHKAQAEYARVSDRRSERERKQELRRSELREELGRLQEALQDAPQATPDALTADLQRYEAQVERVSLKIAASTAEYNNIERMMRGACPTCKRPYSDPQHRHEHEARLQEVSEEIEDFKREKVGIVSKIVSVREKLMSIKVFKNQLKNNQVRMKQLKRELQEIDDDSDDASLSAFRSIIKRHKSAIEGIQGRMKVHEHVANDASKEIPHYKFLEDAFGSRGIRSLLLDDLRAILAYHVDEFTDMLCGDEIRVEFPTGGSFEIIVKSRDETAELSTLSEGEVWRAGFAVLCALRETIKYLNTTKLDFILIDDPIGDLDEVGSELVVEMAEKLATRYSNVIMTLPREPAGVPQDSIIRVSKFKRSSTVEV